METELALRWEVGPFLLTVECPLETEQDLDGAPGYKSFLCPCFLFARK